MFCFFLNNTKSALLTLDPNPSNIVDNTTITIFVSMLIEWLKTSHVIWNWVSAKTTIWFLTLKVLSTHSDSQCSVIRAQLHFHHNNGKLFSKATIPPTNQHRFAAHNLSPWKHSNVAQREWDKRDKIVQFSPNEGKVSGKAVMKIIFKQEIERTKDSLRYFQSLSFLLPVWYFLLKFAISISAL